jgi:hypothetical protein
MSTAQTPMANDLNIGVVELKVDASRQSAVPYGVGFDATPRSSMTAVVGGGQPISSLS